MCVGIKSLCIPGLFVVIQSTLQIIKSFTLVAFSLAASVSLTGCFPNDALFPLKVGNTWVYEAVSPIGKNVRTVKVTGTIPVGSVEGFELDTESGLTDLAWSNGELLAGKLSGTSFTPPLKMLKESAKEWSWKGKMTTPDGIFDAQASATSSLEDRTVSDRKVKTVQVTLTIIAQPTTRPSTAPSSNSPAVTSGKKIETISWYQRGIGLVGQEQRNDGVLMTKLQYVSGP